MRIKHGRRGRGGLAVSLEEDSNRNLVEFFAEELASGNIGLITSGARRSMGKLGIIEHENGNYGKLILSDLGRKLLEEVGS